MRLSRLSRGLWSTALVLLSIPATNAAAEDSWLNPGGITRTLHSGIDGATIPAAAVPFDPAGLDAVLESAPMARGDRRVILGLPSPDGAIANFEIVETATLAPELQARRPQLRTYRGVGIEDPSLIVRFTRRPGRFDALVDGPRGWSITTEAAGPSDEVILWWHADDPGFTRFECLVQDTFAPRQDAPVPAGAAWSGDALRTYRLAISGPGEFAQFHGSVADAEAEIVTLVNIANAYFERDLSVSMQLVDVNVYADPATDPFTNGQAMTDLTITENHDALVAKLGSNGFDLGHVVSRLNGPGWSGLGAVAVPCNRFSKGRGGTFAGNPSAFALREGILHEMGHQLGARHSFNGSVAACGPNRAPGWAYEIGSGVSNMSYAGICDTENVVGSHLLFYDAGALEAIAATVAGNTNCGDEQPTANTAPVADAGADYTIPRETAFVLDGSGSFDPDGDPLTYAWEQHDLGPASPPYGPEFGPLFRNFAPTDEPVRSVPEYDSWRNGISTRFEYLPTVDRVLNFRLVVRDEVTGSGGVSYDDMMITVAGDPFRITSPDGGESFAGGSIVPISWEVGGGAVASDVRVLFSYDSGTNWTEIEASTPNDGAHDLLLPCTPTTTARIRIEPVGNVFFDISNGDFQLTTETGLPVVTCPPPISVAATSADGIDKDDPALADWIASASVVDNCDPDPPLNFSAPQTIPVGTNQYFFFTVDASGNLGSCTTEVTVTPVTATGAVPGRTAILGARPNPFNPRTAIRFRLARQQTVRLEILDLRGRRIEVVHDGALADGIHDLTWDAGGVASGVYIARLETADGTFHRRLALIK